MYGHDAVRPDQEHCMYGPVSNQPDRETCTYGRVAVGPGPEPCKYGPLATQPAQEPSWKKGGWTPDICFSGGNALGTVTMIRDKKPKLRCDSRGPTTTRGVCGARWSPYAVCRRASRPFFSGIKCRILPDSARLVRSSSIWAPDPHYLTPTSPRSTRQMPPSKRTQSSPAPRTQEQTPTSPLDMRSGSSTAEEERSVLIPPAPEIEPHEETGLAALPRAKTTRRRSPTAEPGALEAGLYVLLGLAILALVFISWRAELPDLVVNTLLLAGAYIATGAFSKRFGIQMPRLGFLSQEGGREGKS